MYTELELCLYSINIDVFPEKGLVVLFRAVSCEVVRAEEKVVLPMRHNRKRFENVVFICLQSLFHGIWCFSLGRFGGRACGGLFPSCSAYFPKGHGVGCRKHHILQAGGDAAGVVIHCGDLQW